MCRRVGDQWARTLRVTHKKTNESEEYEGEQFVLAALVVSNNSISQRRIVITCSDVQVLRPLPFVAHHRCQLDESRTTADY